MHIFIGPEVLDIRPLEITLPPTRLMQQMAYGQTVYRDATGQWFTVYAPGTDQLAGATRVYQGGRVYVLTDVQQAELIAAGLGAYISQVDETVAPWCNPPYTNASNAPVDPTALVGVGVVGVSVLA